MGHNKRRSRTQHSVSPSSDGHNSENRFSLIYHLAGAVSKPNNSTSMEPSEDPFLFTLSCFFSHTLLTHSLLPILNILFFIVKCTEA